MVDKVIVATEYTADSRGYVRGAKAGEKTAKEYQKALDASTRAADKQAASVETLGGKIRSQIPVVNQLSTSFKSFATSPAGAVSALTAVSGALGALVVRQANFAQQIGNLSKVTNTTVESLSQYRFVAKATGLEFDRVADGFKELTIRLGEQQKATVDALSEIGLNISDLQKLKADEALKRIADAFAQIESPVKRAALAEELFADVGTDLLPLLDLGSAGIEDLRLKAEELGVTLTEQDVEASKEFNLQLAELRAEIDDVALSIGEFLVGPATEFVKWARDAYEETQGVASSLVDLAAELVGIEQAINAVEPIDRVFQLKEFKQSVEQSIPLIDNFIRSVTKVEEAEEKTGKAADKKTRAVKEQGKAVSEARKRLQMMDRHLREVAEEEKRLAEQTKRATDRQRELNEQIEQGIIIIDGWEVDLLAGADAAEESSEKYEELKQTLIDVGLAFAGAAISGGSFKDALSAILPLLGSGAGGFLGSFFGPTGQAIGSGLGSFLGGALSGVFGGKDKQPTVKFQTFDGAPIGEGPVGDTGNAGRSRLSNVLITGSGGRRVPGAQDLVDAVIDLDNTIASALTPEQIDATREAATFSAKDSLTGFDFERRLQQRTEAIFDAIGGELDAAFDMLIDGAELSAEELGDVVDQLIALDKAIDEGTISDEFGGSVQEVTQQLLDLAEGNETIADTYARVVNETDRAEAALGNLRTGTIDLSADVATALVDLAGGVDEFERKVNFFRQQFLTEDERAQIDFDTAERETKAFLEAMRELGFEVGSTRDEFKDFVLSLDLSTEAGRQAYAQALDVADSFDFLNDIADEVAAGEQQRDQERDRILEQERQREQERQQIAERERQDRLQALRERFQVRNINQPVISGSTAADRVSAVISRALGRSAGFDTTIAGSARLQISALQSELANVERLLRIPRTPATERRFQQLLQTELRRAVSQRQGTVSSISALNQQFPGLGEERFSLMQEFGRLFDGTDLTELERTTGFAEFRERWKEIVEGAASAVLDPLDAIDERAGDISDYLTSILLGDFSSLTQQQQLDLAEKNFFDLVSRAREGEPIDASALTSAHQALIGEIRDTFGIGPESVARFNLATDALAQLGQQIARENDQQVQLDQLTELRSILEEMRRLTRTVQQSAPQARAL